MSNGRILLNSPLDGATITWTSSDDSVATVKDGVVTGVSLGTATITASDGKDTATAAITVKDSGTEPEYVPMYVGDKEKLTADGKIKYYEVDEEGWKKIAKIQKKGKRLVVKAKNPGIITITAYGKNDVVLGQWTVDVTEEDF